MAERKQEKVTPDGKCPWAAGRYPCGGCSGDTTAYEKTLQVKLEGLKKTLGGVCVPDMIVGADHPLHYRNKVHRVLVSGGRGKVVAGIYQAGTHRVIPVDHCLIEDERAQAVIADTVELIRRFHYEIYNEDTGRGMLRHVLVRTAHATGELMLILVSASNYLPGQKDFVREILRLHPEITTIVLSENRKRTTFVMGEREKVLYGPGFIRDRLCGRIFRISAGSFYQINSEQTEKLYTQAVRMAGLDGTQTVIDAYCGIATIGLCAADKAQLVLGAELNARAVSDAVKNIHENDLTNVRVLKADAGDFLEILAGKPGTERDRTVLFLDPPRSGATEKFLKSALRLAPARIVYISCGPQSLARDLKMLGRKYRVEKATAFDMFPFTKEHVETVTSLIRK
jgi:23S rRNA (uracil1939-C5)-methyltransferase